jgi:ribosomal protein S27E
MEVVPTQRAYRAPCPGCGAPVSFLSAQSTHAICAYCQSTVVRNGEVLSRVGRMGELFDDHSPLQLQASGTWQGQSFTLLGRLQYKYGEGTWTEWHALLGDGRSAYLSEDNGAYVFTTALNLKHAMPTAEDCRVGAIIAADGKPFTVTSNQQVELIAAQGELPRLPTLGASFTIVELRSQEVDARGVGAVLSVDYSTEPPGVSMGTSVRLEDLKLSGLQTESAKDEKGRQFACPNCGAALTMQLQSSKSMSCRVCNSIIDLSQGVGAELRHTVQDVPFQPLIPLGTMGTLQGAQWQVVGFQHRMGVNMGGGNESFGWEEYLLYNVKRGFIFLVDSTEGWSVMKPLTGAPVTSKDGQSTTYLGTRYRFKESYNAETNFVAGEFYWRVSRGQKTYNREFSAGKNLLSKEQSANEITWSAGSAIDSSAVAQAFKLEGKQDMLKRHDVGPFVTTRNLLLRPDFLLIVMFVVFILILSRCSSNCDPNVENCSSSGGRTSGGSFGGYSSGGGHK